MTIETRLIDGSEHLIQDVDKLEIIDDNCYITFTTGELSIYIKGSIKSMLIKEDQQWQRKQKH